MALLKNGRDPFEFEGAEVFLSPLRWFDGEKSVQIRFCCAGGHMMHRHEWVYDVGGTMVEDWIYAGYGQAQRERALGGAKRVESPTPIVRHVLLMSDFSECDWRVSSWVPWAHRQYEGCSEIQAYRVHQVCINRNKWFQRHEWQYAGKNSTDLEPWIHNKGMGYLSRFPAHMVPFETDDVLYFAA